jgi:hypothetical protein
MENKAARVALTKIRNQVMTEVNDCDYSWCSSRVTISHEEIRAITLAIFALKRLETIEEWCLQIKADQPELHQAYGAGYDTAQFDVATILGVSDKF